MLRTSKAAYGIHEYCKHTIKGALFSAEHGTVVKMVSETGVTFKDMYCTCFWICTKASSLDLLQQQVRSLFLTVAVLV